MLKLKEDIEKIAVLGLDALSWNYFEKLAKVGAVPNLKCIASKSIKLLLHAYPPVTPPSWTSILTGVNPGKHGIFAFDYMDKKSWRQKLYTATDLKHPRIHEMLGMINIPSIMINPIPGYPIIPIKNTYVISGMLGTPKIFYHPKTLEKYQKILGEPPKVFRGRNLSDFAVKWENVLNKYLTIVEDLVNFDWKIFWLNVELPDVMLHLFPNLLYEDAKEERKLFTLIDIMAKILSENSDVFILVSDHGFTAYHAKVSINDILFRCGYVRTTIEENKLKEVIDLRPWTTIHDYDERKKKAYIKLPYKLVQLLNSNQLKPLKRIMKSISKLTLKKDVKIKMPNVDPAASIAFMPSRSSYGIYVKSPQLIDEIINILNATKGIKWAKRREEIFTGPFISKAPDIMICPDFNEKYILSGNKLLGKVIIKGNFADHHPIGLFSIYSKSDDVALPLKDGGIIENYEVTPLILYLLRLPLPIDTDSKLVKEMQVKTTEKYKKMWEIIKRIHRVRIKIQT